MYKYGKNTVINWFNTITHGKSNTRPRQTNNKHSHVNKNVAITLHRTIKLP